MSGHAQSRYSLFLCSDNLGRALVPALAWVNVLFDSNIISESINIFQKAFCPSVLNYTFLYNQRFNIFIERDENRFNQITSA